jgi:hypothetical protein
MKGVLLKTVAAAIDATGTVESGTMVGIRYVNARGEIKEMQISKRVASRKKTKAKAKGKSSGEPNRKVSALIPIVDHTDGDQFKDLFLFGIIAFDPDGDLSTFYPVIRGNVNR